MKKKSRSLIQIRRNYVRILKFQRKLLIKLIIHDHATITEASKLLNINYSAAKATIDNIRKKNLKKHANPSSKRCTYKQIVNYGCVQYSVRSSIFGRESCTKHFRFDVLLCQK